MSFKNRKYVDSITIQSVDDAISPVNKFSNIRITYFWYSPSASRIVSQNCFNVVDKGINKPDRALQTITCNEIFYIKQVFASFL